MTDKTLGPASAELVLRLSANDKTIFTIADAQAITGKDSDATARLLSQMARQRCLVRPAPGKYLIVPLEAGLENIPMADRYVIARHVTGSTPYDISHYSVLELHQMTTQPVNTIYVTMPRQPADCWCRVPLRLRQPARFLRIRTILGDRAGASTDQRPGENDANPRSSDPPGKSRLAVCGVSGEAEIGLEPTTFRL